MHPGRGPGLTSRRLGQRGGVESVLLSELQMPNHPHQLHGTEEDVDGSSCVGNYLGVGNSNYAGTTDNNTLADTILELQGGSTAHNNLQPFLTLNFIIALVGLYPSRS